MKPNWLTGVAVKMDRWFSPAGIEEDGSPCPAGLRVLLMPTALDRSLRDITAGRQRVLVKVAHGRQVLADSRDGGLSLWRVGTDVYVRLSRRADLAAARAAARRGFRRLSVGLLTELVYTRHGVAGPLMIVKRARLKEVSLCKAGACPGARLLIASEVEMATNKRSCKKPRRPKPRKARGGKPLPRLLAVPQGCLGAGPAGRLFVGGGPATIHG